MSISIENVKILLKNIGAIYNYEMIITGSCADMFNIGYLDIDDIDIIIQEKVFNANANLMHNFQEISSLKSKIDGHMLKMYHFKYDNFFSKIDFLIKNPSIIEKETIKIKDDDITYTIISPQKRYNQLLNNNYKKSSINYKNKIKKVQTRIALYEKMFFQTQEAGVDKTIPSV